MSETYELESVKQVRNNLLQSVIGILRDWVLDRQESFTISDIYFDPELSKKLCLDSEMIRTIESALMKLNCKVSGTVNGEDFSLTVYEPPKIVRIDRDLLVS